MLIVLHILYMYGMHTAVVNIVLSACELYRAYIIYISVLYMYMFNKTEHAISHGFYSIFKFDIINKYIEMLQLDRVVFL